jgi:hypothetical protein
LPSRGHILRPPPTPLGRRRQPHLQYGLKTAGVLRPYCNRADTYWYTMDKAIPPEIIENRINRWDNRTDQNRLERVQASS